MRNQKIVELVTIFVLGSIPTVAINARIFGKPNSMLIITLMVLMVLALFAVAHFVAGRHPHHEPGTDKQLRS